MPSCSAAATGPTWTASRWASSAAHRSWYQMLGPGAGLPRSLLRSWGGGAGEDAVVLLPAPGGADGQVAALLLDLAAGADLLGGLALGLLATFGEEQLRVAVLAGGQVQPPPPLQPRPLRCSRGRGARLPVVGGAQGADDPLHVGLAGAQFGGQVGEVDPPAALDLPLLVGGLDALADARCPGLQRDKGAGDVVAAGAKLTGQPSRVERLPGGLLAAEGQLDAVGERIRRHRPGRLPLGRGPAGAEPLGEGGELIGVNLAVLGRGGAQAGQPRVLLADPAERV